MNEEAVDAREFGDSVHIGGIGFLSVARSSALPPFDVKALP